MQNPFMLGTHVSFISINVSSFVQSFNYYHHDLGFTVISKSEQSCIFGTSDFIPILEIIEQANFPYQKRQAGLYHFAILLPNREELGRFLHHLIKRQIPVSGAADHGVSEAFYLQDPDHNGIEVYADRSHSLWYNEFQEMTMTTKEIDYTGLYYAGEGLDEFTTLPSGTILGHLHLYVSNLEKSRQFYEAAIGFNATVETFPGALFLSSEGYHHHLGLNTWLGKNLPKRNKATLGMNQYTLTYSKCETLSKTLLRLKELHFSVEELSDGYRTLDPDDNPIKLVLQA